MFKLITIFAALVLFACAVCVFNIVISLIYKRIYKLTMYFVALFCSLFCFLSGWLLLKDAPLAAKDSFSGEFLYILSQAGNGSKMASVVLYCNLALFIVLGIYIFICIRKFIKGVKYAAHEVNETVKYTKDAVKRGTEKINPFSKKEKLIENTEEPETVEPEVIETVVEEQTVIEPAVEVTPVEEVSTEERVIVSYDPDTGEPVYKTED